MFRFFKYYIFIMIFFLPLWAYVPTQELINAYRGFELNHGQVLDFEGNSVKDIIFSTKAPGLDLFFKNDGVSYVIYSKKSEEISSERESNYTRDMLNKEESFTTEYARVDLKLVGGKIERSNIVFEDELPGYVNYYLPSCPYGITNIKTYRVVRVKEVYPGIDWVFRYDIDGNLHHEFVVKPEGDPEKIKLNVKWADVKVRESGSEVILSTPVGEILDGSIYAYEGERKVKVNYSFENGLLAYDVRNWSRRDNLVIDPPLARLWATYYGGESGDRPNSVATDPQGNIYVVGYTSSGNFPVYNPGGGAYFQGSRAGYSDAFILKFNSSGVRLWATYYGGNYSNSANSITTDPQGNVYVVGYTGSNDFPVYNPGGGAYYQGNLAGYNDAFILKFGSSGVRLWATYYGGNNDENAYSVTTDPQGNVYVVGYTVSTNFPVYNPGGGAYYQGSKNGYNDAFILKFNSSGVRLWATYYGGNSGSYAQSVATDPQGNVYAVGYTSSTNFPVYNPGGGAYFQGSNAGYNDAFILKFNSSGVRMWATYYGGILGEYEPSVATDPQGNVYLVGYTSSADFPVYNPGGGAYYQGSNAGHTDAFILKFGSSGVRLWATYYGGNYSDNAYSVTVDFQGNVYVVGYTNSNDFPVYNPGGSAYYDGALDTTDAFILKFSSSSARLWATYYGRDDYYDWQGDIWFGDYASYATVDIEGNVYVLGYTYSYNFPVYNPGGGAYYQGNNGGDYDAFILKFDGGYVALVSPENGAILNSQNVILAWRPYIFPDGATRYQVQVGLDSNFYSAPTYETIDTSYNFTLSDTTYYWRVRAVNINTGEISPWSRVRRFTVDTRAPSVPIVVSPSSNDTLTHATVIFVWRRSSDVKVVLNYDLQYSVDQNFSDTLTISRTTQDTTFLDALNDGIYYWRVRARDVAGNTSQWSAVLNFVVDSLPPLTPVLIYPRNDSIVIGPSVTLVWSGSNPGTGIKEYELQYSVDPIFVNYTSIRVSDTTRTLNLPDSTYYWRVRAFDYLNRSSPFSTVWRFYLAKLPGAPTLVSPANDAFLGNSNVLFIWRRITTSYISKYELQYSTEPNFISPVVAFLNDTAYLAILDNGDYYWRVRAYNRYNYPGDWSEVRSFEVDMIAPNTPTLVRPVGGFVNNTTVTFVWTRVTKLVTGGEKPAPVVYDFYIDTTSSFATAEVRTLEDTTITLTLTEARYYWRVRARDLAGNIGNYSTTADFVLDVTSPMIEGTTVWQDTSYMGPFNITTRVTDNVSGINLVKLFYKRSTDSDWAEVTMFYNTSTGEFEGEIPAVSNAGDSVYYYVWASDSAENQATDPQNAPDNYYSFKVIPTSVSEVVTEPKIKVSTKGNLIIMNIKMPLASRAKFNIYDIAGRSVYGPVVEDVSAGQTKFEIKVPNPGVYFYNIETLFMKSRGKVVIVR
jgi:hypothetical protein